MSARFELTAAAAEDPSLADRLRAESPESRAELLVEADGLRAGSESQLRLALTVYRALHADVDPKADAGLARAVWVLDHTRGLPPTVAPLVRRTAESAREASVRLRATVLAAQLSEREGDVDGAQALLGDVMRAVRGSGSAIEFAALEAAARIAVDHEDCARALAFAAGALALSTDATPAAPRLRAHRCRADAFGAMRDVLRFEREILSAEALVRRVPLDERGPLRAEIAMSRGAALLRLRLPKMAVPWFEQALEVTGDEAAPARRRIVHVLMARAMLDLDRVDLGARHVARGIRSPVHDDVVDYELELHQIRLQRIAGGPSSARPRAILLVERLATSGLKVVGPGRRARLATDLAHVLREPGGDLDAARRAFDLAATSMVEAISRCDRDAAGLPELGTLSDDDLAALREHRDRELAVHTEVEWSVARFFEDAARRRGPAFLAGRDDDGSGITACAWCGRIRGTDGRWLSISHFLPSEDEFALTHAACETCTGPLLRELATAVSRR